MFRLSLSWAATIRLYHAWIFLLSCAFALKTADETHRQAFVRSVLHHGDPALFAPLLFKVTNRECIRVSIIGGSVSAGHGVPNGTAAYPALFDQFINEVFPCEGRHNVTTLAKGATASDYWIDFLVGRQELLLGDTDVVIVDTSVNDMHEMMKDAGRGADPDVFIRSQTEILMALLLQRPHRAAGLTPANATSYCSTTTNYSRTWTGAAVLYLGTSTRRGDVWRGPLPRTTDAVHTQLAVAIAHGVPYVSIIDGFGPFSTPAGEAWLNTSWYSEPVSDMHPGPWGHQMLARAVVHFLTAQVLFQGHRPWHDPQPAPYCPRPPAFVKQSVLDKYLDTSPLHIPTVYRKTTAGRMKGCAEWAIRSDVPGKPGLITETVGAKCTVVARAEEVGRHPVQIGEVHVMLLKSYEHMGVVRLTVMAVAASARTRGGGGGEPECGDGDAGAADPEAVLGSKDIDCLWGQHVSEARVEVVPISRPKTNAGTCMLFVFEAREAGRTENKIKVLGLTVF